MRILVLITGDYGRRHVENLRQHSPPHWQIDTWETPKVLPPVIDYPEDYLPAVLEPCDLILSLAEVKGAAELIPDIAQMTGARAVIAPRPGCRSAWHASSPGGWSAWESRV